MPSSVKGGGGDLDEDVGWFRGGGGPKKAIL